MITITVNNTLSRKREPLKPLNDLRVTIYACGVTVYDYCHLGHAMQAICYDVMRRFLRHAGYQVKYVRNYTDVDDKIIARALDLKIPPNILADRMIEAEEKDMQAIGVEPPDHAPRVSRMIPEIVNMIAELVRKQYAYATKDGDVYFRVRKKADYGKLSGRAPEELVSGTRQLVQGDKEDEHDFALWKHDEIAGASWPSPWGIGRPGWHIECSAMAKELLGSTIDIHGGGRDLVFPHHENEIAQSEAANDAPLANVWLHSGLLTINGHKMSKSTGNFIFIKDFLGDWPAAVLRLVILSHHYSSNIDFSETAFEHAYRRLLYYYETLGNLKSFAPPHTKADSATKPLLSINPERLRQDFMAAMADDFNTAKALADINVLFRKVNELLKAKDGPAKTYTATLIVDAIEFFDEVLQLFTAEPQGFIRTARDRLAHRLGLDTAAIERLTFERDHARRNKDFALADAIRNQLAAMGVELRDGLQKTDWGIRYSHDD